MSISFIVKADNQARTVEDIKYNVVRPNIQKNIGDDLDRLADTAKGVQFILVMLVNIIDHLENGTDLHPAYVQLMEYVKQRRYVDGLKLRVDVDDALQLIETMLVREDAVATEVEKQHQGRTE